MVPSKSEVKQSGTLKGYSWPKEILELPFGTGYLAQTVLFLPIYALTGANVEYRFRDCAILLWPFSNLGPPTAPPMTPDKLFLPPDNYSELRPPDFGEDPAARTDRE